MYDLNFVHDCLRVHKPNIDDLYKWEYSVSLNNLPNSREVKCFMYCLLVGFEIVENGTTTFNSIKPIETVNLMTKEQQKRTLRMGRKCLVKNNDLCEMAFQMSLCGKKNSNEDFVLLWRNDTKPGPLIIDY